MLGPVKWVVRPVDRRPEAVFYDVLCCQSSSRNSLGGAATFPAIVKRCCVSVKTTEAPRLPESGSEADRHSRPPKRMEGVDLYLLGEKHEANRSRGPVTCADLDNVPECSRHCLDPRQGKSNHPVWSLPGNTCDTTWA